MNDKKYSTLFTTASIFILVWAILNSVQYFASVEFRVFFNFRAVSCAIAYLVPLLIPVGMLARNRKLCFAGCCLSIVFVVVRICTDWDVIRLGRYSVFSRLRGWQIDVILLFILCMIGCFTERKKSAILSFACAIFMVYAFVGSLTDFSFDLSKLSRFFNAWSRVFNPEFNPFTKSYIFSYRDLSYPLMCTSYVFGTIGCILCGLSVAKLPEHVAVPSVRAIPVQNAASNKIDKIVNLKSLLDQGIITQEDFDKKKKEIME